MLPDGSENEVLTSSSLNSRNIILNRPKALNSLNPSMVQKISEYIKKFEDSDLCNNIIIKSTSPRAYCAGGDVVSIAKGVKEKTPGMSAFFRDEYTLNHALATVKKPVVAIMSGVTMGGGVGISVHAPFRVASENTLLAMPETLIGFFTDVGASFYLPRLDGEIGTYLGLTGYRLKGKDAFYAGFATHYVPLERIPLLEARLNELPTKSHDSVNAAIEEFVEESDGTFDFSLAPYMNAINRCFKYDTVEEIMDALNKETEHPEWAKTTIDTLNTMSPTSLKVTLELLRRGKKMQIQECFQMESYLAAQIILGPDFYEGISELLIKKTKNPKWNPSAITDIPLQQVIERFFDLKDPEATIQFSNEQNYFEYPFRKYGLPTANDIRDFISGSDLSSSEVVFTADEIVGIFENKYNFKVGVKEKIQFILKTNTIESSNKDFKSVIWKS
ncbi:hypothetical protein BB560_007015 [Smittium megazygosporum]|uniref:3-hydroxyisobutyryl-CoA hydrolase n=1 Tax=Smittium megazygosporum TaxID=133381 RepID=A0A2T9XZB0_9FUNG|nr:hypothetical protein BB560_007015 [Smittium megazygosporum]